AYSPFEPVMAVLARAADRPPEDVIPEIVLAAYRTVAGRTGILRTLLLEITSMNPELSEAFADTGLRAFGTFGQYLAAQMAAGGGRPSDTHPRRPAPANASDPGPAEPGWRCDVPPPGRAGDEPGASRGAHGRRGRPAVRSHLV